jgi:hypothetical protein
MPNIQPRATMPRPTVKEILEHPTFPDAIWKLTPTQSGMLPVAAGRGGPFKIKWEVHGKGPIKLVVRLLPPEEEPLRRSSTATVLSRD